MAVTFRAVLALLALLPALALAQVTYTVTSTADSGPGSLRQAILDTNVTAVGPTVTIAFGIPGAGPHVIAPLTQLPAIERGNLVIDGYTQPGTSENSLALGQNNAVLAIRLDGSSGIPNGLTLARGVNDVTIRGLSITRFTFAAFVQDNSVFGGASNTRLVGNWLGLAPDGAPFPSQRAVYLHNAVASVGLATPADQNLIVSTNWAIEGAGLGRASVVNNAFGLRPDGTAFPTNTGIFGASAVILGSFSACCPDSSFTARHFVGSATDGGNVFAAMSGPVMQAGEGATFLRNRVIAPAVDTLDLRFPEPRPTITSVAFGNGYTLVQGGFAGGATSQDVRLEFHASNAPDPNRRGAADTYLGFVTTTANASGAGTFATQIFGEWRNLSVWKTPLTSLGTSLPATFVGPTLSASPSPVALSAPVGGSASQVVTITNGGSSFVTFGSLAVTGAGLSLANDTCSGQTVTGSGGTCSVRVNFAPGATGLVDGTLSAPIAGAGSPVTTAIASTFLTDIDATGTPPTLPLVVTPIGTGDGTVSGTPSPAIACARVASVNTGTCAANHAPGTVVTLTATPASGSSFAFWSGDCSGASPTCQVTLDAARSVMAAFVTGGVVVGTPVTLSVSAPDSVALGSPLTVTATLVATPPGAIDGTVTFFNGATALCTTVQPVVGNAASCTVTPTSTTPLAVWATYSGSPTYLPAQSTPKAVDVTGGTGASLAIDFGAVVPGTAGSVRTVLVGNPTGAAFTISQVTSTGDFAVSHACPPALGPGETCAVTVTFAPTVVGERTGTLSVVTVPSQASVSLGLAGRGIDPAVAPRLSVTPASLAFADTPVGSSTILGLPVNITNTGLTEATGLLAVASSPFVVAPANVGVFPSTCGATLPPGQTCTVRVRFAPTATGSASASLVVSAANVAPSVTVALTGRGIAVPPRTMEAVVSPVLAVPGQSAPVRVLVYGTEPACDVDGQIRSGPCVTQCIRRVPTSGGGFTSTTLSGSCLSNFCQPHVPSGSTCNDVVIGQSTSQRVPLPSVAVNWTVAGANTAGCTLAASTSLSGIGGIAAVEAFTAGAGTCDVEARNGTGAVAPGATVRVEAPADQTRVANLECEGVTPTPGVSYDVAQSVLSVNGAFIASDTNSVPVQGAKLQIVVLEPASQSVSVPTIVTADASGRAPFTLGVGTRKAGDVLVRASLEGTSVGAECRVRVRQSPSSLVPSENTVIPEIVVDGSGNVVSARAGQLCARILDRAGEPYAVSGEPIAFEIPPAQPSLSFARPSAFDGLTDATGAACTPAASISLSKPGDPYDFTVTARYAGTSPPLTTSYRLSGAATGVVATSGDRRMRAVNPFPTGAVGAPYPQPLCVTVYDRRVGSPPPGCTSCPGLPYEEGVADLPVTFDVLSPASGPSVGLRALTGTGPGSDRLETATEPATIRVPTISLSGFRLTSNGQACVVAVANANVGAVSVRATSSVGSVLFTLLNATSAPSAVSIGASTLTVAQEALVGQPVSIQVKDTSGRPVAGATVNFAVRIDRDPPLGFGTPSLSPVSATTDSLGIARTSVRVNGYPFAFRVVATTLLPAAAIQSAPGMAATLENGIFEVEFLVFPLAVPDPSKDPGGDADGDGIPNGVELAQGTYALDKDNDVFRDARLFAMQQYRDFLRREGDPDGIAYWTAQLASGALSRDRVIEAFFSSAEFQGRIAPVARLYFAYFLRIPDYGGLDFWTGFFASNSLDAVSDFFSRSPEFAARYGALDNPQFVTLVYQNVLGRAPDAAGLAFWTGQLASGAMTRGQVMLGFSESAEYRAAIANEVYVTMSYQGMLRREADAQGFAFWVGYMDAGNAGRDLLNGFLNAPEYRKRFLP
jgi:hypothetical protein